jgi:phosphatidylinositol alpha-1,6-mannosyltransferase
VNHIYLAAHARELLFNPFREGSVIGKGYSWYRKRILKYVDYFFPVSTYTADLLEEKGVDPYKIDVVINGTDPDLFYPKEEVDLRRELKLEGKKVLLTITRLVSRKGIDTVLASLPSVIEKYPDIIYLVVGDGDYKEALKDIVDRYNLGNYVRFTGKIPHKNLISYYNLCDVFVMPSKTELPDVEGFGLVFLEANACGKPVIGSKSGGIPSAIKHKETGLLVEEQNPEELKNAIFTLLDNPEFSKELGKKGRERVLEKRTGTRQLKILERKWLKSIKIKQFVL